MRADAEKAKEMLLDRRRILTRRVPEQLAEARQLRADVQASSGDDALDCEVISRLGALAETEVREIREIDAALQRIESERYGRCETCGGAIGRGRLQAVPEARRCVECSSSPPSVRR